MQIYNLLDQVQTKACAWDAGGRPRTKISLKDLGHILGVDTDAVVPHDNFDRVAHLPSGNMDVGLIGSILGCIRQEIREHLLKRKFVGLDILRQGIDIA